MAPNFTTCPDFSVSAAMNRLQNGSVEPFGQKATAVRADLAFGFKVQTETLPETQPSKNVHPKARASPIARLSGILKCPEGAGPQAACRLRHSGRMFDARMTEALTNFVSPAQAGQGAGAQAVPPINDAPQGVPQMVRKSWVPRGMQICRWLACTWGPNAATR
jgi:hypothetical protein